jgi:hypothetical protein
MDRDINKLVEPFKSKVIKFLADKRIKELWVIVTEAYRSQQRQNELYAQWRTKPWPIVTSNFFSLFSVAINTPCYVDVWSRQQDQRIIR